MHFRPSITTLAGEQQLHMFCSYQDESQRLLILFVVQILLRQNKQNNHWLAVSLSHRRNGSVIYFGGQSVNGQK